MTRTAMMNAGGWPAATEIFVAHQLKNLRMRP
jgi:hypothetical protein